MPASLAYFAVGCTTALAIVVGFYSIPGAALCLVCAFMIYRFGRQDAEEGFLPHPAGFAPNALELEVLEESEDELIVRGSDRVLILNRAKKTLAESTLRSHHLTRFATCRSRLALDHPTDTARENILSASRWAFFLRSPWATRTVRWKLQQWLQNSAHGPAKK